MDDPFNVVRWPAGPPQQPSADEIQLGSKSSPYAPRQADEQHRVKRLAASWLFYALLATAELASIISIGVSFWVGGGLTTAPSDHERFWTYIMNPFMVAGEVGIAVGTVGILVALLARRHAAKLSRAISLVAVAVIAALLINAATLADYRYHPGAQIKAFFASIELPLYFHVNSTQLDTDPPAADRKWTVKGTASDPCPEIRVALGRIADPGDRVVDSGAGTMLVGGAVPRFALHG